MEKKILKNEEINVCNAYDGAVKITSLVSEDTIRELHQYLTEEFSDLGTFSHISKDVFGFTYMKVYKYNSELPSKVLAWCIRQNVKFSWSSEVGDDLTAKKVDRELNK